MCWCLPVSVLPNGVASPVIPRGSTVHFSSALLVPQAPELGGCSLQEPRGWLVPQQQAGVSLVKVLPQDSESNPTARAWQLERPIRADCIMISPALDLMSDLITRV